MRGLSNPGSLLKSERSTSAYSSLTLREPLRQFSAMRLTTNKTLSTVATIPKRRDRNRAIIPLARFGRGDLMCCGELAVDRGAAVDRVGGVIMESPVGNVAASAKIESHIVAIAEPLIDSVGGGTSETAAVEHDSGSFSKTDNESNMASSPMTRTSIRNIGHHDGKL
jgi:hypothetical protein